MVGVGGGPTLTPHNKHNLTGRTDEKSRRSGKKLRRGNVMAGTLVAKHVVAAPGG